MVAIIKVINNFFFIKVKYEVSFYNFIVNWNKHLFNCHFKMYKKNKIKIKYYIK